MANRPRAAIEDHSGEPVEAIDVEFEDRSKLAADLRDEEQAILEEFGDVADDVPMHFNVRRILPESKLMPHVMEGTKADLPIIPKLRDQHGGGKFQVWIFKKGRLFSKKEIMVEAPRVPIARGADPGLAQALQGQQEILRTLLERTRETPPAPARPPLSVQDITAMIAAAATVIPVIKDAFASKQTPFNPIEMLQSVIELVGSANTGGREKGAFDLLGDVINSPFMATLAEKMQFPATGGQVQNTPLLAAPQPVQQTQVKPTTSGPAQQVSMEQVIKQQLQYLLTRAKANKEPELYAELLYDQDELRPFMPMLLRPDALNILIQMEPELGQHAVWFGNFLACLTDLANDGTSDIASGGEFAQTNSPAQNIASPHVSGLRPATVEHNQSTGGETGGLDNAQTNAGFDAL